MEIAKKFHSTRVAISKSAHNVIINFDCLYSFSPRRVSKGRAIWYPGETWKFCEKKNKNFKAEEEEEEKKNWEEKFAARIST